MRLACQRFRLAAAGASVTELDAMLAPLPPHAEQYLCRDLLAHADGDTPMLRRALLRKQERQMSAGIDAGVCSIAAYQLRLEECLAMVSDPRCGTEFVRHLAALLRLGATVQGTAGLMQARLTALSSETLQQLRHALRCADAASMQQQLVGSGEAAAERCSLNYVS